MKLFLDSADISQVVELGRWGVIDGITTTPTFFRRLGIGDVAEAIRRLAREVDGEVHVEALGRSTAEIVATARANHALGDNVVSKIPISAAALEATRALAADGIAVNLHLAFTVTQAVLAAKAGAAYVCPLLGRIYDAGLDGAAVVGEMVRALAPHPALHASIMVSSIRSVEAARFALLSGAHAITVPPSVLRAMLESPLTDGACAILARDSLADALVAERMRALDSVAVLLPDARLGEALVEMTRRGLGIALIVAERRLVGVVTDGDVRRALVQQSMSGDLTVASIMTKQPKSVALEDRIGQAVELMRNHRIGDVVVVDAEGVPRGLLSLHDLMLSERAG